FVPVAALAIAGIATGSLMEDDGLLAVSFVMGFTATLISSMFITAALADVRPEKYVVLVEQANKVDAAIHELYASEEAP
ncbi:MAG TPA: hypothetical protein VJB16_00185, partial [archaeon]|nr:hypothetical protein [archaeon]